jgi:hypothetical protein
MSIYLINKNDISDKHEEYENWLVVTIFQHTREWEPHIRTAYYVRSLINTLITIKPQFVWKICMILEDLSEWQIILEQIYWAAGSLLNSPNSVFGVYKLKTQLLRKSLLKL